MEKYQDAYTTVEKTKTVSAAMGEMMNDAMSGIFSSKEGIHDLSEWLNRKQGVKEQKSVIGTLADHFRGIETAMRNLLNRGTLTSSGCHAAMIAERNASKIRKMILDEMDVAIENAAKAKVGNNNFSGQVVTGAKYSIKIIDPDEMKARTAKNAHDVMNMDPVAKIDPNSFNDRSKSPSQQINDYFNSIGNNVYNDELGDIELSARGAKTFIAHGLNRGKMVALSAVPDVIKKGKVVAYESNWKGRGKETAIIAAPVNDGVNVSLIAVVVTRSSQKQRYYTHSIMELKMDDTHKTGTYALAGKHSGGESSIYNSIAQSLEEYDRKTDEQKNILDVNGVRYITYRTGDESARKQAISSLEDVKFSLNDVDMPTDDQMLKPFDEMTDEEYLRAVNVISSVLGSRGQSVEGVHISKPDFPEHFYFLAYHFILLLL